MSFSNRTWARELGLGLALLVSGLASCQTAVPGYRYEGLGPDERVLVLADALAQQRESGGGDMNDGILVDPERIGNELRQLALEYPSHAPTLYLLATLSFEKGRHERAAAYLDDLFVATPIHPEAGLLRSRLAIADGNLNSARRTLEEQIRYTPDHAALREALGSVAFMEGDFDEGRLQLEMAHRLGAPRWRVRYNMGLIEEAANKPNQAMLHFEHCLDERPNFRPAASRLAALRAESEAVLP